MAWELFHAVAPPYLSRLERQFRKLQVRGSNPCGGFRFCAPHVGDCLDRPNPPNCVLTLFLVTPHNVPVDWTVAMLYGVIFSMLGIVFFALGYREMLRVGRRKKLNTS